MCGRDVSNVSHLLGNGGVTNSANDLRDSCELLRRFKGIREIPDRN